MGMSFYRKFEVGWLCRLAMLLGWLWFSRVALTQVATPDVTVGAALRNLASRSGVAFVGRITEINRGTGVVEVVFRVEKPLLGDLGATYTLREWAGLWAAGQYRYSVGERVAIFLHAPGKAGLSSPVDGMEGILPVVQESADSEPLVDIRRLATRVQRKVGEPIVDAANGAMTLTDAADTVVGWKEILRPEPIRRPLPVGIEPIVAAPVAIDHIPASPIATNPIVVAPVSLGPIDTLRLPIGIAQ
jgi:hypothetical protein